ncbi:MAG: divalent-cation tolerance protein CutA [Acidobacteriota bacterium]
MEYIFVITTVPDRELGERLSKAIVESKLAACVTISSSCKSFYWWEKNITEDEEFILFIKTKNSLYEKLENKIKQLHTYSIPEIISFKIEKGNKDYLKWIDEVI